MFSLTGGGNNTYWGSGWWTRDEFSSLGTRSSCEILFKNPYFLNQYVFMALMDMKEHLLISKLSYFEEKQNANCISRIKYFI